MNEMVDRAAAAAANGFAPYAQFSEMPDWLKDKWRDAVRAAIAAIRDPTETMVDVGWNEIDWNNADRIWSLLGCSQETSERQDIEDCWHAMIDAALGMKSE